MVSIVPPATCTAFKAQDHNASRSNNTSINMPVETQDDVGIENSSSEFTLHPNPTNGIAYISSQSKIYDIEIYDIAGRLVIFKTQIFEMDYTIDLNQFENGLYTMKITTERAVIKTKLIKN